MSLSQKLKKGEKGYFTYKGYTMFLKGKGPLTKSDIQKCVRFREHIDDIVRKKRRRR